MLTHSRSARPWKSHRLIGATGLILLVAMSLNVAGVRAAEVPIHAQLFSYFANPLREEKSPPHPPYPPPFEGFEGACGVALDSAGDVYVADYYHDVVDVFRPNPEGVLGYVTQIAAVDPSDGPCGLAVDNDPASPSFGDVYVNNWRQDVVKYTPSEFPPQPAKTSFPPKPATSYSATVLDPGRATGVATDLHGNLFVDERTDVAEYGPSGTLIHRFGEGTLGASPGSGYGIAVSSYPATEGDVYVADAAGHEVKVYGPAGEPLSPIEGAGTPQAGFNSLLDSSLAIDPTDGHLYVADNLLEPFEHPLMVVDEFNGSGAYRGQISSAVNGLSGLPHALADGEPSGLAVDGSGDVYVTAGNSEEAALYAFGPTTPAHTLEVAKTGTGSGTVTSKPAGIACGEACSAEYSEGEEVTLTAKASPGSSFAGFSGPGCNGTGACHLTLGANTAVSAKFEALPPRPLSLVEPAAGSLSAASAAAQTSPPLTLALAKAAVKGPTATLQVTIPASGTLSASGPGLSPTGLPVSAGKATLHLHLNRRGKRALQRAKRHRLELKVAVTFAPNDGGPASALTKTLTFKQPIRSKQR
jgi:hypothetical protein